MKALLQWLIRNRKVVITVAGMAFEYIPKAYRFTKEKLKKWKHKKKV